MSVRDLSRLGGRGNTPAGIKRYKLIRFLFVYRNRGTEEQRNGSAWRADKFNFEEYRGTLQKKFIHSN